MSDGYQHDLPDFRTPEVIGLFQPLPWWLADRLLQPNEKVTWVRGPWFNPPWERYVTHPALFLLALGIGMVSLGLGWLILGGSEILVALALAAGFLIFVTICVLGIANGYFTRLIVTDSRLFILQGYETVRCWNLDDLPRSLLRYGPRGDEEGRSIDLDAVKTLLGGSSDQFTDARTILSFGKQLDRIQKGERDRR